MRFIQPPWENYFFSKIQASESLLFLVSPYIKYSTAALLHAVLQTRQNKGLSVQILTRVSIRDINEGASDLEAFEVLLQLSETHDMELTIKYISNLHAKVYIFDNMAAIVTSSNLTPSGMNRNVEYGIELNDPESVQQICSEMNKYWQKAEILTPQIIEEIRSRLALTESVVTIAPEPIIIPATSESKIHSHSTRIVNKRLKPHGIDIEMMELDDLRDSIASTKPNRKKKAKMVIYVPRDIIMAQQESEDVHSEADDLAGQEDVIEVESAYGELEQEPVEDIIHELTSENRKTRLEAAKRLKALYVLDKESILQHIDELALELSKLVIRNPHSCYRLLRFMHDSSMVSLSTQILEIVKEEQGSLPWPVLKHLYRTAPSELTAILDKAVRKPLSLSAKRNAVHYLTELGSVLEDNDSIISTLKFLTSQVDYRVAGIAFGCLGKLQGLESRGFLKEAWALSQKRGNPVQVQVGILKGLVGAGVTEEEQEFFSRLSYSHIDKFRSISIKAMEQLGKITWYRLAKMAESDSSAKVRSDAIRALVTIDPVSARELLANLIESDPEESVRLAIREQLNKLRYEFFGKLPETERNSILKDKLEELNSSDRKVKLKAARFFGKVKDPAGIKALHIALKDNDDMVRAAIAETLGTIGNIISFEPLVQILENDPYHHARAAAAKALGKIGDKRAIEILKKALDDDSGQVRKWSDESIELLSIEQ